MRFWEFEILCHYRIFFISKLSMQIEMHSNILTNILSSAVSFLLFKDEWVPKVPAVLCVLNVILTCTYGDFVI